MFGSDLLVAPKVNDFAQPYEVKLPAGLWYDFWTGQPVARSNPDRRPSARHASRLRTGRNDSAAAAGGTEYERSPAGPARIFVYPGPNCQGSLYQDDGNTLAYLVASSCESGLHANPALRLCG